MATTKSTSFLRPTKPSLFARMVYQVGSPAILDGNMFLPDTGTPIWKIERSSTRLAVWLPEPLTVATWMLKSLTRRGVAATSPAAGGLGGITLILNSSSGGNRLTLEKL